MSRIVLALAIGIALLSISATNASAQFVEKKTLSLAAAKKMAAAAEAEAAKNNWNMVISVLDDGGNLLYLERMDGAQLGSIEVSQGKARTALRFRRPSKAFQDLVDKDQAHLMTLPLPIPIPGSLASSV